MTRRGLLWRSLKRRRDIRASFELWCEHALAPIGQSPARHHRLLIKELQDIEDGTNDRLMIMMPPGSAKSTYASKLFPAHYLARHPGALVIGASHGQSLADTFSEDVQRFVTEHSKTLGYQLSNTAKDYWRTDNRGAYRAVGTGGSVTGRRASLVIWDDPLKGHEEADSETFREKAWNWYRSDLITRLLPGARIVLISTRWHEDDPCGRLLAEMKNGGDKWRVVSLPAIAEGSDPLGREPGEVLWPEWEDAAAIARKRRIVGERVFASLFQQQPRPSEGSIIKAGWWQHWTDELPTPEITVLSLDLAYTKKDENDPSACTVWDVAIGDDFRAKAILRFAWAERLEFPELIDGILKSAKAYQRPYVPLYLLVEGKGPGLSVVQELRKRAPQLRVHTINPTQDKVARAHSVTAMFEDGVVHVRAQKDGEVSAVKPWAEMVINECAAFPLGAHDDLTDTVTQFLRHFRDSGFELHAEDAPAPAQFKEKPALY